MKNSRNLLTLMLIAALVIMAACGNSSDESGANMDNQTQNNSSTQSANEESAKEDAAETASNTESTDAETEANEKEDTSAKEEDSATNNTEDSLKEEYLEKLNDAKKETEELEATDTSTYALKKVENDRWEIWDRLLNEIYGVLQEQLSPEEMEQLREEQREWLQYRDDTALEASLEYKGGTQEHLEYVAVLANLTEERCYELVDNYMK
ncbi:lysozyme inhibitor LprI family protein [Sutcliffiella deserti]|uniref:lysozyme inhibitor LprI family protein n=1 Tax=Sutcliffiella deserti TaxID=2875501 RepID=UPI001CBBCC11|nr:lysozyme inhibitor LprI family protein [Sutcliffiella deserti]